MTRNRTATRDVPSQLEQEIAYTYVVDREIVRPRLGVSYTIFLSFAAMIITTLAISLLGFVLDFWGLVNIYPDTIQMGKFGISSIFLFFVVSIITTTFLVAFLRRMLIGTVFLYQRYAPEYIRRKCLYKPTCSEYTILALTKYGVIIGLYKAYIRIFKKCKGFTYRIEYP